MLSGEQLQSIMPRLWPGKNDEVLPFLQTAMTEFSIATPARTAAFLAQLAHESSQLRFMEEIWGPTEAQRRYEPPSPLATKLGNTEGGDGQRFKGRGPIQLTGRMNYERFGNLLGVDLVSDPARAATGDVAFRIAGLYWSRKGLNGLADLATDGAFREITRRINGGFNGLADRQAFYAVARQVLGVPDAPITRGGTRSRSTADAANELLLERGFEAIRAGARRRRARKTPPARRRTRSSSRVKRPAKRGTRRRSAASNRKR
jgi:putative chitinase